jgi:hypothetical protein
MAEAAPIKQALMLARMLTLVIFSLCIHVGALSTRGIKAKRTASSIQYRTWFAVARNASRSPRAAVAMATLTILVLFSFRARKAGEGAILLLSSHPDLHRPGQGQSLLPSWPGLDGTLSPSGRCCRQSPCTAAILDGEIIVQDENGISEFDALRSAIHKALHRIVFFAFDLLHLDVQDLRGQPLRERRGLLRRLIQQDPRCPIQFSDHLEGDGARFLKAAAELGLEGIVSKRAASRYRSGRSRSWLKTKNMVVSEFVLLGTDRDSDGVPWALLASDRDGQLEFAGPAILNPPQALKAAWRERMAAFAVAKPPVRGVEAGHGSVASA